MAKAHRSKMWILHVQICSTEQDASVLDLLHFPSSPLLPSDAEMSAASWASGKVTRNNSRSTQELVRVLSSRHMNEVKVDYSFAPHQVPHGPITLERVNCILEISPTNTLWQSAKGFEAPDPSTESIRRTFENREIGMKWHGISAYPTLLETQVLLRCDLMRDELIEAMFPLLARSVPTVLATRPLIGCADVKEDRGLVGVLPNMLEALAPWPRAFELLGDRIDDLHQVIIAKGSLCRNIVQELGSAARFQEVSPEERQNSVGFILFPREVLKDPTTPVLLQSWLVPKDETTARTRELNSAVGEFRFGSNVFYTAKRNAELVRDGLIAEPKSGWAFYYLIHSKYCKMMGIEEDEMLVDLWQESLIKSEQQKIDDYFAQMPEDIPLDQRVWVAHRDIWKKRALSSQVVSFLRERFFPTAEILIN